MIRIAHTACLALFFSVALVAYGAKEETRALEREIEALLAEEAALKGEIVGLETERDHLNSGPALKALARRLFKDGVARDAEGAALAPWTPTQLIDLGAPRQSEARP